MNDRPEDGAFREHSSAADKLGQSETAGASGRAALHFGLATALAGVIGVLAGGLVLAGWALDVAALKSVLPGWVSMKPNTAAAFVLAGASLLLLARPSPSPRRVRTGQALALLVVLLGGLTLGEFFFGWQLGLDELLFKDDPNAAATLIPGRMAPSTAVCCVLLGLGLAGIEWESRRGFRPAELLAFLIGAVSLASLVEYGVDQPILYGFSQYTRMAPPTAVVFLVLAAGVLLARPAQGMVGTFRIRRINRWELGVYAGVALLLLAVLFGGAWFYHAQEQQVRREVEVNLEAIARLKVNQIVEWRAERLADGGGLMGSQFFADGVATWLANPQAEIEEKILARFQALERSNHYQDILLADRRGQVRLSLSGHPSALHEDTVKSLATVLKTGQLLLTDLHVPPGDPTPHIEVIAPLFTGNGAKRELIGALILQFEARQFLYPLIESWPTPSPSAETLLVRREGDSVVFLNELRHRRDSAFKLRLPLTRTEVVAVMAALGAEGVVRGVDYRGVNVLAVAKKIPDSTWIMMAKVDEVEALAEWRFRAGLIVVVIVALAFALAAADLMIGQQRAKYRALTQSAEALRKANRAYRVLSEGNQALVRASAEPQLLRAVCQLLIEHGGYRLAWVGFAEDDAARSVRPVAQAGFEEGYLAGLQITWADTERGHGPTGTAIRTRRPVACRNIMADPDFAPWRDDAVKRGYASSLVLPLGSNGRAFGALNIYAAEADAFDAGEMKLLVELSEDLAFGLTALRAQAGRRQAEEALLRANAYYRSLIEVSLDPLVTIGPDGRITDVNAASETGTGRSRTELIGTDFSDYFTEPEKARAGYEQVFRDGLVRNYPLELRHRDGHVTPVLYNASVYRDANGAVIGVFAAARDVTELQRAEHEIRQLNADLERRVQERTAELAAANQELESFSYSVSHDLRAPLRSIDGFSRILLEDYGGKLDDEGQDSLTRVRAASQRMAQLIDDLLKLARTGRTELRRTVVDLSALAGEVAAELQRAEPARRVTWVIAPDLSALADRSLVRIMLENLLGNAWKFTGRQAEAHIEFGATQDDRDRAFFVRDNGAGFDMAYAGKLFAPFQRLHAAADFGGTGIGLATVQRVVRRQGGRVWAESEVNHGATFYFTLPAPSQPP